MARVRATNHIFLMVKPTHITYTLTAQPTLLPDDMPNVRDTLHSPPQQRAE
ncbi:MAG TPA: hypothetical protein VK638_20210 [Edaphobacter sp.]|nr:hypothetical protein [Edaphobacter sp.]